jgi:hypothetical protein
MTMHNEEGQLLEKVFHRLLSLGVVIVSLAVLVWLVWAVVRTCQITNDAAQPGTSTETGSLMQETPGQKPPLANVRAPGSEAAEPAAQPGNPGKLVKLCFRPVASLAGRIDGGLDRLPRAVASAAENTAFFADGPS